MQPEAVAAVAPVAVLATVVVFGAELAVEGVAVGVSEVADEPRHVRRAEAR